MENGVYVEDGMRGVAWRLKAHSSSGGKIYSIAVVGNSLVIGWGRLTAAGAYGAGSEVTVVRYATVAEAMRGAQMKTDAKSRAGYALDIPPHTIEFADIPMPVGFDPKQVVKRILMNGQPL